MKNITDFEQLFLENFNELTEEELLQTNGGGLIDWVMKLEIFLLNLKL